MNEHYSNRKHPRLPNYDYNTCGAYFVTICTLGRKCILSQISNPSDPILVGRGLAPAAVTLSRIGNIVKDQLAHLEDRYSNIKIDRYVIMPNHIHILLRIEQETAGASPRPTLSDAICSFKSLSTRLAGRGQIFQASFYDHVIRDMNDYLAVWQYIDENPVKWNLDEYFNQP